MPGRALRCIVEVKINTLSCPGVWLPSRRDLYLRMSILDIHYQSKLLDATFPLLVFQTFQFEKLFSSCFDPAGLAEELEEKPVYFELVQVCPHLEVDQVVAFYRTDARSFLFPTPTLRPSYCGTNRDILFHPRPNFPGVIGPKMVFSTSTVILEAGFSSFSHPVAGHFKRPNTSNLASFRKRSRSQSPEYSFHSPKKGSHCTVCHLFKKYFGRSYAGHQNLPPVEHKRWFTDNSTDLKNLDEEVPWSLQKPSWNMNDNIDYTRQPNEMEVDNYLYQPARKSFATADGYYDHKTYRQLFNESLARKYSEMNQCSCCNKCKTKF